MSNGDIRIAYILLIHKNYKQVNAFLDQLLYDKNCDIYVHVDKKGRTQILDKITKDPRINILENSMDIVWGDISLTDAIILLIKEVIRSGKVYDFVCLRSGQDLVVRQGFIQFLSENRTKNFLTIEKIDDNRSLYSSFVSVKWPKCTRRQYDNLHPYRLFRSLLIRLYRRGINFLPNPEKLPGNYDLYHGSTWFSINMDTIRFINEFIKDNPWYYNAFKNALCSDEFFFHTIIMNSKYTASVVNENFMYLRWGISLKERSHPVILKTADISLIEDSQKFCARKFDEDIDNSVIEYFCLKTAHVEESINESRQIV